MLCTDIGLPSVGRTFWTRCYAGALGWLDRVVSTFEVLNLFVSQVVIIRRDSRLLRWGNWLREDSGV